MEDPRARDSVWRFFETWLELDEGVDVDAELAGFASGEGLSEALVAEARAFVEQVLWNEDGGFADLMERAYVATDDDRVAALYDLSAGEHEGARAGLLLRAALLQTSTLATAPISRGVFVLRRMLCEDMPAPDLETVAERLGDVEGEHGPERARDVIARVTDDGPCQGCHSRINPIAFALEDFDSLGRSRDVEPLFEHGAVVDEVPWRPADLNVSLDGEERALSTGASLTETLAASEAARSCFVQRLRVHAATHPIEADCRAQDLGAAVQEGLSLRELFVEAVVDDAFTLRPLR